MKTPFLSVPVNIEDHSSTLQLSIYPSTTILTLHLSVSLHFLFFPSLLPSLFLFTLTHSLFFPVFCLFLTVPTLYFIFSCQLSLTFKSLTLFHSLSLCLHFFLSILISKFYIFISFISPSLNCHSIHHVYPGNTLSTT